MSVIFSLAQSECLEYDLTKFKKKIIMINLNLFINVESYSFLFVFMPVYFLKRIITESHKFHSTRCQFSLIENCLFDIPFLHFYTPLLRNGSAFSNQLACTTCVGVEIKVPL